MKQFLRKSLGLLAFSLVSQFSNAQESNKSSFSVFTGGMFLKNSVLSTTKLGYEIGNFGFLVDFTYDDYKETWEDGSRSTFRLNGYSASTRYYLKPLGRSLFAEASIGIGTPKLTTKEGAEEKVRTDNLTFAGYGLGWRFGKKPKGVFGELGFRMTYSLKESHLYTSELKPNTENLENISYQSWLFENGKGSGQIYLGIGYSF